MHEKLFPHLTLHLFAQSISVLRWISSWLTSRHFGRGAQVPRLEVMLLSLESYGDQQLRRRVCPELVADRAMFLMLLEVFLFL